MQEITNNISFAPIGLLDMFNSSGAVEQFEVHLTTEKKPELFVGEAASAAISLKVRGCGRFGAYSSQRPQKCMVGNADTDFDYDSASGLLVLTIPIPQEEMFRWPIEIVV